MSAMNNHMPLPPAVTVPVSPFRRRVATTSPARTILGLRGTAYGPAGETLAIWALWAAGSTAELALEEPVDGALTGAGWTVDVPGLGHFALTLTSRRGCACRCELAALNVDRTALAAAGTRH